MEAALYDPEAGFFALGGGAGRAEGDFITSPEVGSFFGVLVARALDRWWDELGQPDPFVVVEAGAGRGRLAADVLRAAPRCAPALRYVLVERSAALRAAQADLLPLEPPALALGPSVVVDPEEAPEPVAAAGPVAASLPELPAGRFAGVVLANELLDNLPFRVVERAAGGWREVRVGVAAPEPRRGEPRTGEPRTGFAEVLVPADPALAAVVDEVLGDTTPEPGARFPVTTGLDAWLRDCAALVRRGFVAVFDYGAEVSDLLARGQAGWLRTYRAQRPGGPPLEDPGTQDITADVPLAALRRAAVNTGFRVLEERTQADWLGHLGIGALVEEARAAWHARAATDLAALAARSRVHEADALCDPAGLGAHQVVVLGKGL